MKNIYLNPTMKKSIPLNLHETKKWKINSWTILPNKKGFFLKIGQHKKIPKFVILDSKMKIIGKTSGLSFQGKNLF